MKSLFAIIILAFTQDCFCQKTDEANLEGLRTIKILEINSYKSPNHYIIKALDKESDKEFFVFSDKEGELKCQSDGKLVRLERHKSYQVNLSIFPLFPLTISNDSLGVTFDSRPVQVTFNDLIFTKDNPPYFSSEMIGDKICLTKDI